MLDTVMNTKKSVSSPDTPSVTVVRARLKVLEAHERIVERIRRLLRERGTRMCDVLGAPGAGKTTLILQLVSRLKREFSIGYIAGDLATSIDAERLQQLGIPAVQINTIRACHLEAPWVEEALRALYEKAGRLDLVFTENVGNLICPFEFDIGADVRLLVFSIDSGGPEKLRKYPIAILRSDVIAINKCDLASVLGVDVSSVAEAAREMNPRADVVCVSAKTGEGIEELISVLRRRLSL